MFHNLSANQIYEYRKYKSAITADVKDEVGVDWELYKVWRDSICLLIMEVNIGEIFDNHLNGVKVYVVFWNLHGKLYRINTVFVCCPPVRLIKYEQSVFILPLKLCEMYRWYDVVHSIQIFEIIFYWIHRLRSLCSKTLIYLLASTKFTCNSSNTFDSKSQDRFFLEYIIWYPLRS